MRNFPVLENGTSPEEFVIHVLEAGEDVRELLGISASRWRDMKSGRTPVKKREWVLLRFLLGYEAPPTWGEFKSLRHWHGKLYLSDSMRPKDGVTRAEIMCMPMTRAQIRQCEGQSEIIERLSKERNFYRKQCGFEAKYGLMVWQLFG